MKGKVEMSREQPSYASDVPYVPMNFNDRDILVGQLMEVLEAVMPQGTQLEATKNLVKKTVSQHFVRSFNDQFQVLTHRSPTLGGILEDCMEAIWEANLANLPSKGDSESIEN